MGFAKPEPGKLHPLFHQSRWRLAAWYSGVMGVVLAIGSLGMYETIAHAHRVTVDRELQSIAQTLHSILETQLDPSAPGTAASALSPRDRLPQILPTLLPQVCWVAPPPPGLTPDPRCDWSPMADPPQVAVGVPFHPLYSNAYYIRILQANGQPIATAGLLPAQIPPPVPGPPADWQVIDHGAGHRYHQVSLPLGSLTAPHRTWGYVQVGRSFQDFDAYLAVVRWSMILGFPLILGGVALGSWALAGKAMAPLYQAYQQMQQFTADAAHELRTPLAAIRATVESVLPSSPPCPPGPGSRTSFPVSSPVSSPVSFPVSSPVSSQCAPAVVPDPDSADLREILQVVNRQTQRLGTLVNDLLLLSRLDQNQWSAPRWDPPTPLGSPCLVQDWVGDVAEELAALALEHQVTLGVEAEAEPLWVWGQEEYLYNLLMNVVINAIHAMAEPGHVSLRISSTPSQGLISVEDTGVGLAAADQALVFRRFYRVEADRSRQQGGSGLGLAIAQAIVQAHGGSIRLRSSLGQGTTVTIQLPRCGPPV